MMQDDITKSELPVSLCDVTFAAVGSLVKRTGTKTPDPLFFGLDQMDGAAGVTVTRGPRGTCGLCFDLQCVTVLLST